MSIDAPFRDVTRELVDIGPLQEVIPEWLAVAIALATQLGDVWFVALILAVLYWTYRREAAAITVARTVGGMALLVGLKYLFAFSRPERPLLEVGQLPWLIQPLYEATAFADGYGFPSGHALVTTIVYVSLAGTLTVGTARQRYLAAGAIVAVVSLSRVLLGVHYLVDVLAGVAVGLAYLGGTRWLFSYTPRERATVAFGLAVVFSAGAALTSEFHVEAMALLGASLGGLAGWSTYRLGTTAVAFDRRAGLHLLLIAVGIGPLVAGLEVFGVFVLTGVMAAVGFVAAAAVALPVLIAAFGETAGPFLSFCREVLVWNLRALDPRRDHESPREPAENRKR